MQAEFLKSLKTALTGNAKKVKIYACVWLGDMIYLGAFSNGNQFGRGAVVAQLTVNQLVAGSNPAARAIEKVKRAKFKWQVPTIKQSK